LGHLERLRHDYEKRAEFLFVYVAEGPHELPDAPPPGPDRASKLARIRWHQETSGQYIPWLLDGRDKAVDRAYNASPLRLVLVGTDGRVALDAGDDFREPEGMARVRKCLDEIAGAPAGTGPMH
jgi:hypothetical protein